MTRLKTILLTLITITLFAQGATAQDATTQGKEFWLSFISNGFKNHPQQGTWLRVQLLVSAKRNCEGDIVNPNTGWSHHFTVEANNVFSMDLDETLVYVESNEYEQIVNKGLQITTTDTVSVYCANIATYSFDASYVLPIQGLADDYIIQTAQQSSGVYDPTSAFVIVATEDNTTVDITPSVNTLAGRQAHQEFSITLNKGEAYQVRSNESWNGSRDLSGTRVTARDCKKIAIFNGNNLTLVPANAISDIDCIFEQAMPLRSWGKKFVVTTSLDRSSDYVKITSASDGNEIRRNGVVLTTLNANQSYTFELSNSQKSCYIEALHPCAVYLYNTSSNGSGNGAPSMVWIAPIEQRIDQITFSTFNYEHDNVNIPNHYINIIVESQDIDKVYLDNELLSANLFETVQGNDAYSFMRQRISHDVHHLHCPNGFNAHVYGFGDARGYAYMVGSKATDLSTTISINDEVVVPNDTISNCSLDPLTFIADINLNNYSLVWDFGDGTTSTDNPAQHTYGDNALYEATLTVNSEETPCEGSSALNTYTLFIDTRREPDLNYSDNICAGERYSGHGFSNVLITADTTLTREQPGTLNPDCMIHVNVAISCYPVSDTTITDFVCFSGADTYTGHGFNISYNRPGTYTATRTDTNPYGCERNVNLELTVGDVLDGEVELDDTHCDSIVWNGKTYYESGEYTDTIPNAEGCYSIAHLKLDLEHTPSPSDIYPTDPANTAPHWVITATEFQINAYDLAIANTNNECHWDSITWNFETPNVNWVLEVDTSTDPIGKKCKMYVLEQVTDTVWLVAKVYNKCHPQGVERRYWFVSSFYDVDEHGPSTPSIGSGAFTVMPNPNNGQMTLNFENLTGKIDVKVYDMRGALVDHLQTFSGTERHMLPYQCTLNAGIYCFVVTSTTGNITQKVIISPN